MQLKISEAQYLTTSAFSLRAIYGTDSTKNALHGSDSYSSAEREIHFFFPDSKYNVES